MNKVTYENQGNNTYLVYEITENDIIDNLTGIKKKGCRRAEG